MMNDLSDKKIRILQAKRIAGSGESFSYSKMLNVIVAEGLKHVK